MSQEHQRTATAEATSYQQIQSQRHVQRIEAWPSPFPKCTVSTNESGFSTTVYIKQTNMGLCLDGNSECTQCYMHSTINAYIRHALTHCSTWKNVHQELERLTEMLINNGYPNNESTTAINRTINKWHLIEEKNKSSKHNIKLYYQNFMSSNCKMDERVIKDIIHNNIRPTNPDQDLQLIDNTLQEYKNIPFTNQEPLKTSTGICKG